MRAAARPTVTPSASSIACTRAHLVGDRADAADARGDVGRLAVGAAAQERLEEARRLEDAELGRVRPCRRESTIERAFALDAREVVDLDASYAPCSLGLLPERLGVGVEGAEDARAMSRRAMPSARARAAERSGVRRLHRPEAAVAAAVVGRAERAAAGMGDRAEAGRAVRDHHADIALQLALDADAVMRRSPACAGQKAPRSPRGAGACRSGSRAARNRPARGRRSASRSRAC